MKLHTQCAADAFQRTRIVEIQGKRIGIIAFDNTITEVIGLEHQDDVIISTESMGRIARNNFIPQSLQNAYAKAVFAVYVAMWMKILMEKALKKYKPIRND